MASAMVFVGLSAASVMVSMLYLAAALRIRSSNT